MRLTDSELQWIRNECRARSSPGGIAYDEYPGRGDRGRNYLRDATSTEKPAEPEITQAQAQRLLYWFKKLVALLVQIQAAELAEKQKAGPRIESHPDYKHGANVMEGEGQERLPPAHGVPNAHGMPNDSGPGLGRSLESFLPASGNGSKHYIGDVEHVSPESNPTRRRRWWRAAGGDANPEPSLGELVKVRESVTIAKG